MPRPPDIYETAIITLLNTPGHLNLTPAIVGELVFEFLPIRPGVMWNRIEVVAAGRNVTDIERRAIHQAMMNVMHTEVVYMRPLPVEVDDVPGEHGEFDQYLGWSFLFSGNDTLKFPYQKVHHA